MADLEIVHRPGKGNRITQSNRRQIYKYLEVRDPEEVGPVTIRVCGRMQDHKTRPKLRLLSEELNNELAARDLMWRLKSLRVSFVREAEFSCAELYDTGDKWPSQFLKRGYVELVFGGVGLADL